SLIVYHARTQHVEAIDFDSRAPLALRPEIFREHPSLAELGYLAVGPPGVVAGLDLGIRRYGKLGWPALSRTAIQVGQDGVVLERTQLEPLQRWSEFADPASRRAIFPDGKVPGPGDLWKQPDLAKTIRTIAEQPSSFYQGEIADRIVKQV